MSKHRQTKYNMLSHSNFFLSLALDKYPRTFSLSPTHSNTHLHTHEPTHTHTRTHDLAYVRKGSCAFFSLKDFCQSVENQKFREKNLL